MAKREHGGGSTYQRTRDWRWIGTFDHGWTDKGTRRRISVTGPGCEGGCAKRCPHRTQIQHKLAQRQREIERLGVSDVSSRDTVKKWAGEWLEIEERRLRPKAFATTRSAVTKWIVPTVGHKRFDALTPADVRAVTAAQRKAGLEPSTWVRTHSALMSLLHAALLEGYPVPDRVMAVKPPAAGVSDRTSMQVAEAVAVLQLAAETPQGSRWVGALLNGIRQGEALGLTWDSVDFARNRIVLDWQLQPLPYRVPRDRTSGFRVPDGYEARQLHGRLHLVRPKTKKGWRVLPMLSWMRTSLESWREVAPHSPHGLVWPLTDGRPCDSKVDDLEWYALQCGADVHHPSGRFYTSHETRHTTATLLHEANVEPAIIAVILGQSKLVESYLHVQQSARVAEGLQAVADLLALPAS